MEICFMSLDSHMRVNAVNRFDYLNEFQTARGGV